MKSIACILGLCWATASVAVSAEASKHPVNVLFIIADQFRWDAMSCAGNPVVKTPNLDRIAREGVRFASMYSSCPVCVPARTVMLTGRTCAANQVLSNEEINRRDLPDFVTFDQILLRSGYRGEYHGKWHSPYKYALDYSRPVRWVNGPRPPGCTADMNEGEAFRKYIEANVPDRALKPGEQIANMYGRPYRPDPLDGGSRLTLDQVKKFGRDKKAAASAQVGQGFSYGLLDIPPEHTLAAWTAKEGLAALGRLKDGPFTLTISIGPPHPPMVLPKPYYGMYPAEKIPTPASIGDPLTNSPYEKRSAPDDYRDPVKVRQMMSDYYGLVTEDDDWIGKMLKRLDDLGLAQNTLVIFTADHGEMLGDHGMMSKFVFYEGSVHIPLLMRLPGVIPAGTVVKAPVAQLDLCSTILDYCGRPPQPTDGRNLRPLIEGREGGGDRAAFSEWASPTFPAFMAFDGRWKFLFGRNANARSLDALYDLKNDPLELNNLIGCNPDREKHCAEAERMKGLLVAWLERVKSPAVDDVKARPVLAPSTAIKKRRP